MKLKFLFCAALLGLTGSAFAATPAPAAGTGAQPMHHHEGMDMCKDDAAKFDKWCAANADKCTAVKAFAEKHIEWCSAHEKECAEHRKHEMADLKQFCSKDPSKPHCHAIVAQPAPSAGSTGNPPPK